MSSDEVTVSRKKLLEIKQELEYIASELQQLQKKAEVKKL